MNTDTGHVLMTGELTKLTPQEQAKYTPVPKHLHAAARKAHASKTSMFNAEQERVRQQARALAKKAKAKRKRKLAKQSRRRNAS